MTCKEIVKEYLTKNGYDGLYKPDAPCGCELADFMPCEGEVLDCQAGYQHFNPNPNQDIVWAIFASKETPKNLDWDSVGC
jgi:hypothetical protein